MSRIVLEKSGFRTAGLYGGGTISLSTDNLCGLARLAMGPDTNLQAATRQE